MLLLIVLATIGSLLLLGRGTQLWKRGRHRRRHSRLPLLVLLLL